jgi:hypothetical protein
LGIFASRAFRSGLEWPPEFEPGFRGVTGLKFDATVKTSEIFEYVKSTALCAV